jgi:signal transduction histidine kinase
MLILAFNAMAAEINRRYEELENFAYIAAHDLKSPLTAIYGMSQVLLSDFSEHINEEGKEFLRSIVSSSGRMNALIGNLLEFARAGKVEFSKEPISVNKLIEEIHADLVFSLKERNATLVVQPDLPCVVCDPIRFSQMWKNLITNAVKYNDKPAPLVEIGCESDSDGENMHRFFVRDNGIGIDERQYERIFMPFQRAVHDQKYEGTGIGLAIVKRVVEYHGGRVWVESHIGQGTTFYFTIPRTFG